MRARAAEPYAAVEARLPEFAAALDYDSYRLIQFRPERARKSDPGSPYEIHAFHLGWLYPQPVEIFEVQDGKARRLAFSTEDFDYRDSALAAASKGATLPGVAGLRLNYPINAPGAPDELLSFLGTSYFRALGRNNIYGLSARGLVIDSWVGGVEEFPRFTRFYVEPYVAGEPLTVHAALESPSVMGAYRFVITPGGETEQATVMDVTARLFFRTSVKELGIAPLTSMFLFAENDRTGFDDYRSQVHDSNGLYIARPTGETLWRPLNNPEVLANSYFGETNPVAFGLHQRDRDFSSYQDAGAHYERRPSLSVEPQGAWGTGLVRLVEIPSRLEADDNIVAFWVPAEPVAAGDEREYRYRLRWGDLPAETTTDLAYAIETRTGQGGVSGVPGVENLRKFVVDFAGGELSTLDPWTQLDAFTGVTGGRLVVSTLSKIAEQNIWRLVMDVDVGSSEVVELRAYVIGLGRKLTETWLYQWRAPA